MSSSQAPSGKPPFKGPSFSQGPSFDAFRLRVQSEVNPAMEQINNLTPSSRIQFAGGDTGQQRLAANEPRFEASNIAADVYGLETEPAKGPVRSAMDFIFRPQHAITGALTGLTGQDRYGEERRFGRVGTAVERAFTGLRGEEQYRFSEFTSTGRRVAAGEDVSLVAKGWNSALGFALDVAVDPITYVSLGGSLMGRMRASGVVLSKTQTALKNGLGKNNTNVHNLLEEGSTVYNAIRSEQFAVRANNLAEKLAPKNGYFKTVNFDETSSLKDLLTQSENIFKATGIDVAREVALDTLPEIAAMVYARGGHTGLRLWAIKHFGDEAGEAFFKTMPKDIQGGIRIRVPFVRNADGTPISYGIEGIGAGRLGEKSSTVNKINNMTQDGRDFLRERFAGVLGKMSGAAGDIYYDAVLAATGKRTIGKASSYVDFENAKYAQSRMRELRTVYDEEILKTHQIASDLYDKSVEKFGKKYQDSFFGYMYDTELLQAAGRNYDSLKQHEKSAYNTANTWRHMLDKLGHEAVEVFGDAGRAMYFLQNYVPRAARAEEIARRALDKSPGLGKGAMPDFTKHRAQWPMDWVVDDTGVARVVRWKPNHDIKLLPGGALGEVYEVDPRMWMGIYLTEMRHALNDQIVLNELMKRGYVTRAVREPLRKIDVAEVQRRIVELIDEENAATGSGRLVPDSVRRINEVVADAASWVDTPEAARKGRALSDYLQEQGIDFIDITDVNRYFLDETAPNIVYRNVMLNHNGDPLGSIEQLANGRWRVLTADGPPMTLGANKQPAIFDTLADAQAWADDLLEAARHKSYYKDYLPRERLRLEQETLELMANPNFSLDVIRQLDTLTPDQQGALIDTWLMVLGRFGRDKAEVTVTKSGQPAFFTGPGMRPIDVEINVITDGFKEWLANKGYLNIAGVRLDPDGILTKESQVLVKTKIAEFLGDTYGPAKVIESLQNMFKVQGNPQTWGGKIYNDYYKPFYAAQKAWMTLGRGPGFVVRNIMGGTWNNFIVDVGAPNTLKSARYLAARKAAQVETHAYIKKQGFQLDPLELGEYYRERVRKNLSKNYKGAELDELMDAWEAFSRQGLAGNRETARLFGEILRSTGGSTGRRSPTAAGDVSFGPRGIGQRTQASRDSQFRVTADGGTPGAPVLIQTADDLTLGNRMLEWAAGDNYWIRDVMSPMVEMSEDYLRFSAFLKGVQEIGLEPVETGIRGYGASTWVKATQFDYADLSSFEQSLKMLIPFYTWTRYNVPLQIRAVIHEPSKVAQALRIHESFGDVFGEDDKLEPSYVADRFGFTIDEDSPLFSMLPEWMKPKGDVTLGISWGEPIADVNTLFRNPFHAAKAGKGNLAKNGILNIREIAQQLNPGINAVSEFQRALAESGQEGRRNVEPAPNWARAMGLAYEDPTEPGTWLSNRSVLEAFRSLNPVVGQAERMLPWVVGGERHPGRWTTSLMSALFGLSAATTDDWKKASEMNRRSEFITRQMKAEFGPDWEPRVKMIRRLVDEGAPLDFIQSLDLPDRGPSEMDVMRAVHTWRMLRRVELLIEDGVPEDEILAALSVYVPEGSKAESLVQLLWKYVPKPPGDFERGVGQFGLKPITRQEMKQFGLTTEDIKNMSDEEQRNLIYWINRNRGWLGPLT